MLMLPAMLRIQSVGGPQATSGVPCLAAMRHVNRNTANDGRDAPISALADCVTAGRHDGERERTEKN
jgi:hypothetical protein